MTHGAGECPAYDKEKQQPMATAIEKLEATAKDCNLNVHFLVSAAPDHTLYALVETDKLENVTKFVFMMPMKQECKVTPVAHLADVAKSLVK